MFARQIYLMLCVSTLVKCESTRIRLPATIERNNKSYPYQISAIYEDKRLWIWQKNILTLVELGKDVDFEVERLTIGKCILEHIEKGALDKYTEADEIQIYENNLKELKSDVIKGNLRKAFLRRNKIKYIENEAFKNLRNLKEVFLSDNELEEINPNWFSNCPKLRVLNLHGNKIKHVAKGLFVNISSITTLNLDYNQISSIETGAFEDLIDLKYFGLCFNQITVLPPDIFPNFFEMELFDISFNHLNYISTETLKKLRPGYFHITPNPWNCECLQKIEKWMLKNKFDTVVYVHCDGPQYPVCIHNNKTCEDKFDMEMSTEFYKAFWNVCDRSHFNFTDKDIKYELDIIYMDA